MVHTRFHASSEHYFAMAEVNYGKSMLYCISDDAKAVARELPGKITGITFHGDELLCAVEHSNKRSHGGRLVLYTLDAELRQLSKKSIRSGGFYFFSAMDASALYALNASRAGTSIPENDRAINVLAMLDFTRVDLHTGERTEWVLDDWPDNACTNALEELSSDIFTGVCGMSVFNGRLMLECNVYDRDGQMEVDEPDLDESALCDYNYVEIHSYQETICADITSRTLSNAPVGGFYPEFSGLSYEGYRRGWTIWNAAIVGSKVFAATDKGFICEEQREGKRVISVWETLGSVDEPTGHRDPERYRYFYAWGDRLLFETREDGKLVGFRACPATFDEPSEEEWTSFAL